MRLFKKNAIIVLFSLICCYIQADEGMWVISNLDSVLVSKMKRLGLQLPAKRIYNEQQPSLKDAVVMFDNDCTGELVSKNGLLFTNHHCGRDRVQQVSTATNNYIRDGFWASSMKQEIPIKGLTVKFLIKSVDVTAQAIDLLKTETLRKVQSNIERQYSDSSRHYSANLDSYSDGTYSVSVYQIFSDVRLVGIPPESIGNFGGEADNFEWPRHAADFSIFRVYAGQDNLPAAYSPDNRPYHPKSFLPLSISGVHDNDFALTIGFPYATERDITSYQLKENLDVKNKATVITKGKYLEVLQPEMNNDENIRLKYSSKNFSAGNSYKFSLGILKLVGRSDAIQNKQKKEAAFEQWVNADSTRKQKYGSCLATLKKEYDAEHDVKYAHALLTGALFNDASVFGVRARRLLELVEAQNQGEVDKAIVTFRQWYQPFSKNYDAATDQKIVRAMLKLVKKEVSAEYLPSFFNSIDEKYHGDIDLYVNDLYSKSTFSTQAGIDAFLKNPKLAVREDPLYIYGTSVYDKLIELKKQFTGHDTEIRKINKLYSEGIREKNIASLTYPDANFSMRLTYGTVSGISPRDGLIYKSRTTLNGVMEKEDSTRYEWSVCPRLKELYEAKDYGSYGEKGELYTCFLSSTDITSGNSGSPVINGKGELTGLAFDGNWESLAGSIIYEPEKNRAINVDIRYVLFVIDKFAKAQNIINELTINQ